MQSVALEFVLDLLLIAAFWYQPVLSEYSAEPGCNHEYGAFSAARPVK